MQGEGARIDIEPLGFRLHVIEQRLRQAFARELAPADHRTAADDVERLRPVAVDVRRAEFDLRRFHDARDIGVAGAPTLVAAL